MTRGEDICADLSGTGVQDACACFAGLRSFPGTRLVEQHPSPQAARVQGAQGLTAADAEAFDCPTYAVEVS